MEWSEGAVELRDTLQNCAMNAADFLYIDLKKFRRNTYFNAELIKFKHDYPKIKVVKIEPSKERLASLEKHISLQRLICYKWQRSQKKEKKQAKNYSSHIPALIEWKEDNKINTKISKNFQHLYQNIHSIYNIMYSNQSEAKRKIARASIISIY